MGAFIMVAGLYSSIDSIVEGKLVSYPRGTAVLLILIFARRLPRRNLPRSLHMRQPGIDDIIYTLNWLIKTSSAIPGSPVNEGCKLCFMGVSCVLCYAI